MTLIMALSVAMQMAMFGDIRSTHDLVVTRSQYLQLVSSKADRTRCQLYADAYNEAAVRLPEDMRQIDDTTLLPDRLDAGKCK